MEVINNTTNANQPNENDRPVIVALDIGTTKVATIVAVKNEYNKIEIKGYANIPSQGVMRGTVSNIFQATESIKKSVEEASKKTNAEIGEVVVGVASQNVKSFQQTTTKTRHTDDEITEKDIEEMIKDIKTMCHRPDDQIIAVIPQEFTIDNEPGIQNPIGHNGRHIKGNFHVISVSTAVIKNINKCVENNQIKVLEFYLEPLASAAAVLTEEEKEAGVALIDIGGGTTDIAIYYDNIIRYTAVIPFGGNSITQDIKEVCKLPAKAAEKLKIEKGSAVAIDSLKTEILKINGFTNSQPKTLNSHLLAMIIEARVREILSGINDHLEKSGYKEKLSAGIVLTGGGSLLKNIQIAFLKELGMEARLGISQQHIATNIQELKSPIYSTAVGLLILGFNQFDGDLSKIPNQKEESNTQEKRTSQQLLQEKRENKFMKKFASGIKSLFDSPGNLE